MTLLIGASVTPPPPRLCGADERVRRDTMHEHSAGRAEAWTPSTHSSHATYDWLMAVAQPAADSSQQAYPFPTAGGQSAGVR